MNVTCGSDQTCYRGLCIGGCDNVVCPPGQVCRIGNCVDPCAGITCTDGQVCEGGACLAACGCRNCPERQDLLERRDLRRHRMRQDASATRRRAFASAAPARTAAPASSAPRARTATRANAPSPTAASPFPSPTAELSLPAPAAVTRHRRADGQRRQNGTGGSTAPAAATAPAARRRARGRRQQLQLRLVRGPSAGGSRSVAGGSWLGGAGRARFRVRAADEAGAPRRRDRHGGFGRRSLLARRLLSRTRQYELPQPSSAAELSLVAARGFSADADSLAACSKYFAGRRRRRASTRCATLPRRPGRSPGSADSRSRSSFTEGPVKNALGWYNATEPASTPTSVYSAVPANLTAAPPNGILCADNDFCPLATRTTTQAPQHSLVLAAPRVRPRRQIGSELGRWAGRVRAASEPPVASALRPSTRRRS